MKLKINDKEFSVKVADTDERRTTGLRSLSSLPGEAGLVLKYDTPTRVPITMKGMKFPLGVVHILDGEVQNVVTGDPDQEKDIEIDHDSDSVLEVNVEDVNGIKIGDKVEWVGVKQKGGTIDFVPGEVEPNEGDLHLLNDKGQVLANIKGNERVFSRKDTGNLLAKSMRASETQTDEHYAALGRTFVRIINKQDTQKQEYV